MADVAFAIDHRHVQPRIVRAKTGPPDDGADRTAGEIQSQWRGIFHVRRRKAARSFDLAVEAVFARPGVDGIEQPAHLEIGEGALIAQGTRELDLAVADTRKPTDETHTDGA